jgi:hypothetical protein
VRPSAIKLPTAAVLLGELPPVSGGKPNGAGLVNHRPATYWHLEWDDRNTDLAFEHTGLWIVCRTFLIELEAWTGIELKAA